MRLIIISSSPGGKVVGRFINAARKRGVESLVVGADDIGELLKQDIAEDVAVVRIAPEYNDRAVILDRLQSQGLRILNSPDSWIIARDKWLTYQRLSESGIPTPLTVKIKKGEKITSSIQLARPIFKPLNGTNGVGIVELFYGEEAPDDGVIQEYIEASGSDIRLLVVGRRVVASMKRQARQGDFRANLHQGATACEYTPSDEMSDLAVRSARCLGLDIAGVDIMVADGKFWVIEANPSPGLGIEAVTGVDVAGAIVDDIKSAQIWS